MSAIARIKQIIEGAGFQPEMAEVMEEGRPVQYLTLLLRSDGGARDHQLLIQVFPNERDDPQGVTTSVLSLSLIFPFYIANLEVVPELMRLLLWLNRLVPVGRYGLLEDKRAVDFLYNLVIPDGDQINENVLIQTIGMVAYFTQIHADIIDQVIGGGVTCDDFLEELKRNALAEGGEA